jgi:hypothetical protein
MPYLSTRAKHLISRLSSNNLLGMIENLAYCLSNQTNFFSPSSLQAQWLDQEISALQPHQKLDLIKQIVELVQP